MTCGIINSEKVWTYEVALKVQLEVILNDPWHLNNMCNMKRADASYNPAVNFDAVNK